jgi:hypothetical protein
MINQNQKPSKHCFCIISREKGLTKVNIVKHIPSLILEELGAFTRI